MVEGFEMSAAPIEDDFTGFVYLIVSDEQGFGKIGYCTCEPRQRLTNMQTGNPSRLRLAGFFLAGKDVETILHRQLRDSRHALEWFSDIERLEFLFGCLADAAIDDDDAPCELAPETALRVISEAVDDWASPE